MKIAMFHNLPVGGAKRVLFEQVKGLSGNNQIDLYTYRNQLKNEIFNPNKYCENVYSYKFNIKVPNRIFRDLKKLFLLKIINKQIANDIDSRKYDVVLVHADQYMEAPFLLRYLNTKNVLYDQEMLGICYLPEYKFNANVNFLKRLYEDLFRKYLKIVDQHNTKKADLIIANSKFLKNFIKKVYNINSKYIYPAVDTKIFKNYKTRGNNKKYFLFVGNKGEYENWDLVEKAVNKIKEKHHDIKIKSLKKKKNNFSVNKDTELAKVYSGAIATICSYSGETFGLKAVESMACETPVVALNIAAYPEVVINNKTGYLVETAEEMTEKLEKLLNNPKLRDKMGKNGRKHVLQYDWQGHVKKLEKMLLSLSNG